MDCELYRLAISSSADSEESPVDAATLDTHLLDCTACSAYAAEVLDLDTAVVSSSARPTPDLTAEVLAAVAPTPRARRADGERSQLRAVLALAGLVQAVVTLDHLVGAGVHLARDLAAFELALAGALLYAAWRPVVASGLLPVVLMVAVVGLAGAAVDAVAGGASLPNELPHLLPVLAVLPLWRLSRDRSAVLAPAAGLRW